jgi:7,8-dihydropterin-6-yl-methyl-4-(beta-D-ribofuranosyl)aminobenzene 5'-phosphate synthase
MIQTTRPVALGELGRLRVLCISEVGWLDNNTLLGDVKAAGGMSASQYQLAWPPFGTLHAENAAGVSALIEAEELDGKVRRLLFDTGWNSAWMERRFAREGVDRLLKRGEIAALIISHEHFDHFWGISATLRLCPGITIYVPEGFRSEGLDLIKRQGHTGKVITTRPGEALQLFPGAAVVQFPVQTLLQVQGENVLYFNVANRGITVVTGCGHGGVLNLLDYAREKLGGDRLYAVYGGLHISPFEEWDEARQRTVDALRTYGISRLGCNHCTGLKAVQAMIAAGLPVVKGTGRNGSKTDLFIGNGDVLEVPSADQRDG